MFPKQCRPPRPVPPTIRHVKPVPDEVEPPKPKPYVPPKPKPDEPSPKKKHVHEIPGELCFKYEESLKPNALPDELAIHSMNVTIRQDKKKREKSAEPFAKQYTYQELKPLDEAIRQQNKFRFTPNKET